MGPAAESVAPRGHNECRHYPYKGNDDAFTRFHSQRPIARPEFAFHQTNAAEELFAPITLRAYCRLLSRNLTDNSSEKNELHMESSGLFCDSL